MEINVKKYVIKKLIESYAAKYPFLDENDYRSLAIKNYTEHEIGHVLGSEDPNAQMSKVALDKQNTNRLVNLYNAFGNKEVPLYLPNGRLNPEALKDPNVRRGYTLTKTIKNNEKGPTLQQLITSAQRNAAQVGTISNRNILDLTTGNLGTKRLAVNSMGPSPQG